MKPPYRAMSAPCAVFGMLLIIDWVWLAMRPGVPGMQVVFGAGTGLLAWTLLEYAVHRFVLHPRLKKARPLTPHEHHHLEPKHADYLAVPLRGGLTIFTLIVAATALLTWSLTRVLCVVPGILMGYLIYEWIHFGAHFHKTKIGILQDLYRRHLRHHYEDAQRGFGVTSPLWDLVFRTLPPACATDARLKAK